MLQSNIKSEYNALALIDAKIVWLKSTMIELHVLINNPPVVFCYNLSTTCLAQNPMFHARMKHIDIDYHCLRDQVV